MMEVFRMERRDLQGRKNAIVLDAWFRDQTLEEQAELAEIDVALAQNTVDQAVAQREAYG